MSTHQLRSRRVLLYRRVIGYVVAAVFAASLVSMLIQGASIPNAAWRNDFNTYLERTSSWLAGDGFYYPWQISGPYQITDGVAMYPPVTLLLFAPFTVVPHILWWVIPAAITTAGLWRMRPSPWGWALLAVVAYLRLLTPIAAGNPVIWSLAFLTAGFTWPVLMPWATLRPSVVPWVLPFARRRAWWIGLGLMVVASVPFGTMWIDYVAVLRNAQTTETLGPLYAVGEWPMMLALWVAYLTRSSRGLGAQGRHGRQRPEG
jgi:hypothetical protein